MRPGDRGTAKLVRDWGDRLVSVRYRYSAAPPTRFTTIELVVAAAPWKRSSARRVLVEVKSWEAELRKKVQEAGGRWVPRVKRWSMRYDKAIGLGLNERVSFHAPNASPTPKFSTDIGTRKSTDVGTSPRFKGKGR